MNANDRTSGPLDADAIHIAAGDERAHPIICRRCLNLTAKPGTSGQGIRQ